MILELQINFALMLYYQNHFIIIHIIIFKNQMDTTHVLRPLNHLRASIFLFMEMITLPYS